MKCITRKNASVLAIIIFFLLLVNQVSGAEIQSTELIKLKTRPSITLKIALIKPDNPVAFVVFFKGGKGLFEMNYPAAEQRGINHGNPNLIAASRGELDPERLKSFLVR